MSSVTPGLVEEIRAFVSRKQHEISSTDDASVVLDDGTVLSRSSVCNAAARYINDLGPDSSDAAAGSPAYEFVRRVMTENLAE
jgi:hypothetical protein